MLRFGVRSDRGKIREINEDSCNIIAGYPGVPVSFIVADGMGGHNSGEIASKAAVDFASNYILNFPDTLTDEERIPATIKEIMTKANTEVFNLSKVDKSNFGMGTTLIVAVICNKKLFIGHIGDSRVYIVREDMMERITTDHSYIEELLRNGSLKKEEAENHPKKNIITRALGCTGDIQVDIYNCNIKDNDVFLICTDGLTNMLSEEEIKKMIEAIDDPGLLCEKLVEAANEKGGEDNITVIVFKN